MMSHGVSGCLMVSHDVSWCLMVSHGVSMMSHDNLMVPYGVSRSLNDVS